MLTLLLSAQCPFPINRLALSALVSSDNSFLSIRREPNLEALEGTPPFLQEKHVHCMHAKLLQSCPTLCNPMDCNPPDSSVHGIFQARILEWVAMLSSRGSSQGSNPHLLCLLQ